MQVHGIASRKSSNGGRKTKAGSTHAVEELALQREGSLHGGHEIASQLSSYKLRHNESMASTHIQQTHAHTRMRTQVRSWKSTLLQLLTPLLALLLVTGLSYLPQGLENVPHPQAQRIGTLPKCKVSSVPGHSIDKGADSHCRCSQAPLHPCTQTEDCVLQLMYKAQ